MHLIYALICSVNPTIQYLCTQYVCNCVGAMARACAGVRTTNDDYGSYEMCQNSAFYLCKCACGKFNSTFVLTH